MKKLTIIGLCLLSFYAEATLELEGARWVARSSGYKCVEAGEEVDAPVIHEDMSLYFQGLWTDYSLDNVLIKAKYLDEMSGSACNYRAILFADNAKKTIKLVKSESMTTRQEHGPCKDGKVFLDAQLANNNYLYWGDPDHVTIMIESEEVICEEDNGSVGIDFTLIGKVE